MDDVSKRWRTAMDDVGKKPAQAEAANLREVTEEDLERILAAHKTWLETNGKEGKRASLEAADLRAFNLEKVDLSKADLRLANLAGADLFEANLSGATMFETDLSGASLHTTDLTGTDLRGVNLRDTKLVGTKLREANLQNADLTGATGLMAGQLAGANVSGAKLPEDIHKFEALTTVEEASKNTRKIFLANACRSLKLGRLFTTRKACC